MACEIVHIAARGHHVHEAKQRRAQLRIARGELHRAVVDRPQRAAHPARQGVRQFAADLLDLRLECGAVHAPDSTPPLECAGGRGTLRPMAADGQDPQPVRWEIVSRDEGPGRAPRHPVVVAGDAVLGAAAGATRIGVRVVVAGAGVGVEVARIGARVPGVRSLSTAALGALRPLADSGREVRGETGELLASEGQRLIEAVAPGVVGALDINAIVGEIDIDGVVSQIDINNVVSRIDIDAVVGEIDIDAVVSKIAIDRLVSQIDIDTLVSRIDIDTLVSRIDIDTLVSRIAIDRLVSEIDIDTLVSRIDIDRLVSRIEIDRVVGDIEIDKLVSRIDIDKLVSRIAIDRLVSEIDIDTLVSRIAIDRVVSEIDIDRLVRNIEIDALVRRIDIDHVVGAIDMDAVVDRIDVGAIVDRVDVNEVVQRVDVDSVVEKTELGTIVARSTTGFASEALDAARTQAVDVDDIVTRVVNRVMRRRQENMPLGPGQPAPGPPGEEPKP